MHHFYNICADDDGDIQPGRAVYLYTDRLGTTLAVVTDSGGSPIDNPVIADSGGAVECYYDKAELYYRAAGDTVVRPFPALFLGTGLTGDYQLTREKGVASGYPSLDSTGKVPTTQLPAFQLLSARGVANGYAPLGADAKVPAGYLPVTSGGGGGEGTGPWYNVTDYSVAGDGNGNDASPTGTDNYSALASLQSTIAAAGGGTMFFPAGTYRIGSRLTKSPLVRWVGEGDVSWLWGPVDLDGYASDLRMGAEEYAVKPVNNGSVLLERCRLRGGGGAGSDAAVICFYDNRNSEEFVMRNCRVERNLGVDATHTSGYNNISMIFIADSSATGYHKHLRMEGGVLGYDNGSDHGSPAANIEMLVRVGYTSTGFRDCIRGPQVELIGVTCEASDDFNLDFEGRFANPGSYDHWGGQAEDDVFNSVVVKDCLIKGGGRDALVRGYGVMVECPINFLLESNEIWACEGSPMVCVNGNSVPTSGTPDPNPDYIHWNGVIVRGNKFLPSRSDDGITPDLSSSDSCLRVVGKGCLIEGNVFRLYGHNGIWLDEGSAFNTIRGNFIDDAKPVMSTATTGRAVYVRHDNCSRFSHNRIRSYRKTGPVGFAFERGTIWEDTNSIETLLGRAGVGNGSDVSAGGYRCYQPFGSTFNLPRQVHVTDNFFEVAAQDDDLLMAYQTLPSASTLTANTSKYLGAANTADRYLQFTSGSPAVDNVYSNGYEWVRVLQASGTTCLVERAYGGSLLAAHSASAAWSLVGKAHRWTSSSVFVDQPDVARGILFTCNVTGVSGYGLVIGRTASDMQACDALRTSTGTAASTITAFKYVDEIMLPVNTGGGGTPQMKVGTYARTLGLSHGLLADADVLFVERKASAGSWTAEEPASASRDFQTLTLASDIVAGDSFRVHYRALG